MRPTEAHRGPQGRTIRRARAPAGPEGHRTRRGPQRDPQGRSTRGPAGPEDQTTRAPEGRTIRRTHKGTHRTRRATGPEHQKAAGPAEHQRSQRSQRTRQPDSQKAAGGALSPEGAAPPRRNDFLFFKSAMEVYTYMDDFDDYDVCYECTGYGDDYCYDKTTDDWICLCDTCPHNHEGGESWDD